MKNLLGATLLVLFQLVNLNAQVIESSLGIVAEGKLVVGYLDKQVEMLDRSEIAKLPHKSVKLKNRDGVSAEYSGVSLKVILEHVGITFAKEREGANLSSYILVESIDEYRVVVAFAEIDPGFNDKQILLADRKDGKPIPSPEGSFRLIIPSENQRRGRWVKQVFGVYVIQASWPASRR